VRNPAFAEKTLRSAGPVGTYRFPDFLAPYSGSGHCRFYRDHIGEFDQWVPEPKPHAVQHPKHPQVNPRGCSTSIAVGRQCN
jgi:hypothetical protein